MMFKQHFPVPSVAAMNGGVSFTVQKGVKCAHILDVNVYINVDGERVMPRSTL